MLLALTCAGCATLPSNGSKIAISDACERLATPVKAPAVAAEDLGVLAAKNRAALKKANSRLAATAACQAQQRKRFGGG